MRTIASGIDVKNPTATAVDTYQLKVLSQQAVADRYQASFHKRVSIAASIGRLSPEFATRAAI